jgi:regulator of sigma E protease
LANLNSEPNAARGGDGDADKPRGPSGEPGAGSGGNAAAGGHWNPSQGVLLLLVAVGLAALFKHFGLGGMISLGIVAVGLGLVIFIHELGHFAVAKWCDVHVEVFSIGFGPAIPGCSFVRGETLYKIAWFPLGGYVKMVGEGTDSDEDDDDPRSFKNKSVWQRMAIISAGVIMNVILGFVCFIFVYETHGVERQPAEVGLVDSGGPIWRAPIPTGAVIDRVGGTASPFFEDLRYEVTTSSKGELLQFEYHLPGGKPQTVKIEPRRDKDELWPVIGLAAPLEPKLIDRSHLSSDLRDVLHAPVKLHSAAAAAEPGFQFGDRITATTDPDEPDHLKPLPIDPRDPERKKLDYFEFLRRMKVLEGKPIVLEVSRKGSDGAETQVSIHVAPAYQYTFGFTPRLGQVLAIRHGSPAERAGVQPRDLPQTEGDLIKEVEVTEKDGRKTRWVTSLKKDLAANVTQKLLDPIHLAHDLEEWAARTPGSRKTVSLHILRQVRHEGRKEIAPIQLEWEDRWRFDQEVPYTPQSPMAIPELGLAYQVESVVDSVQENSPANAAGLQRDDVIKAIRFQEAGKNRGDSVPGKWVEVESDQWANIAWVIHATGPLKEIVESIDLRVERGGEVVECHLDGQPDLTWPVEDRGLLLQQDTRLQKANNLLQALSLGIRSTYRSIVGIYLNLKAMLVGRISPKAGAGPITIATMAYDVANQSIYSFILFLGMISINLAVINFLPIPILDGGHMVFLIWEKIRGVPASESARAIATYAGLLVIVALMVFYFWLDITRLVTHKF